MCGIDFVIGVTDKEASKAEKFVHFNERTHAYLINIEKGSGNDFNLLLKLDPYRQTIIYRDKIPDLLVVCEALINKYNLAGEKQCEIRNFAQELKELCEDAIKQKKHIYAIGD
ncbi:hypothetical protein BK139_13660 [Paenibacillus sp. FSL R5-0490]|uniref:hypothetical protein n=1 Tax=Bacillales TaxID=1385 RepID=UPI00096C2D3A|nr:hypothetical protein [Paenibacillus sp. FSL R5-0490]OMF56982.1 hypothetical protein BK139_13660 [Paenibacillus sp. FSL R5-0490]